MIIRHKLGYRIYFPGTHEWEKVAIFVAVAHDIKVPQAFAQICADFFTAQGLMSEMSEREKLVYVKAVLKDAYGVEPNPIWLIKALVLNGLRKGRLDEVDMRRMGAPEDYRRIAAEVLDALNSSTPTLYKLMRLAQLLKPIIQQCYTSREDLSRLLEIFPEAEFEKDGASMILAQMPSELLNKAIASLYSKGDEDVIEFAPDPVAAQAARISIYNELLASRRPGAGQVDSGRYYGTWTMGDEPSQLLIRDTLRTFGTIAPPIFSLKWADGEKGPAASCAHLGLALDVSSSMLSPPSKAARAKEAAYGLAEEARLKAAQLTICYFNGSVLLKRYGARYDEAQRDIASVIVKGQTNLLGAVRSLCEERLDAIVIITDAEVDSPPERSAITHMLEKASEKASISVFLISEVRQPWIEGGAWKTFMIKPGERFVEKIEGII